MPNIKSQKDRVVQAVAEHLCTTFVTCLNIRITTITSRRCTLCNNFSV